MKEYRTKLARNLVASFVTALVALLALPSQAEDKAEEEESPSSIKQEGKLSIREAPWRFEFNVYGWLPAAPFSVTADGFTVRKDEDLDTILDSLDMTLMLEFEVHKGRIGVFASPVYYKGHWDSKFGLPADKRKIRIKETVWLIKYGASYDFGPWRLGSKPDSPTLTLQPYAGALFFHDNMQVNMGAGLIAPSSRSHITIDFNTPIVGMNTIWRFSDRWSFRAGGNYGGWGVDDVDETWEFIGNVVYDFKMWGVDSHAFAGMRYLGNVFTSLFIYNIIENSTRFLI